MMTKKNRRIQSTITPEKNIISQAKRAGGNLADKFRAYLALHAQTLFSSLGRLRKTPLSSVMTITVLAFAISLVCGFYVLLDNAQQLTENLEATNQISLFLKSDKTDADGQKLVDKIKQRKEVKSVELITQELALAEFRKYSGFGDALNALENNPLPTVIQILPKNTLEESDVLQKLVDDLKQLEEVDIAQMDMQWVRRLQSMMDLAQYGIVILSCILSFAVLFIMGNTIRLELEDRREEVLIAKLVGATYAFIQRPFLYTGFWFGFFAGVVAWLMVTIMMLLLKIPMENLSELYDNSYEVLFLGFSESLILLFISSSLGALGAWMVLRFQLKQMKLE